MMDLWPFEFWFIHLLVWLYKEVCTWQKHLELSCIISSAIRRQATLLRERNQGKPRRKPNPPPLRSFPARYMILSGVMVLMSRVSLIMGASLDSFGENGIWAWNHRLQASASMPRIRYPPDPILKPPRWRQAVGRPPGLVPEAPGVDLPPSMIDLPLFCRGWTSLREGEFHTVQVCNEEKEAKLGPKELVGMKAQVHHVSGPSSLVDSFVVIWDTGATCAVSFDKEDFVEYEDSQGTRVLKGIAEGLDIKGYGRVHWTTTAIDGTVRTFDVPAVHVPSCQSRLLSPQSYLQDEKASHHENMKVVMNKNRMVVMDSNKEVLEVPYLESNNLPALQMFNNKKSMDESLSALNSCVTAETNQNLTQSQKFLLQTHWKHAHRNMQSIQQLLRSGALGSTPLHKAAGSCSIPLCASCSFGKGRRRTTHDGKYLKNEEKTLSKDVLYPGQMVSMDHFSVSQKGRLYNSNGETTTGDRYTGGIIFVDHATSYVHVELVLNFTAAEALRAKLSFEKKMADVGVTVGSYHTDNGTFTASAFVKEITENHQTISFSGPGAHHQNGVAERAIGTIISSARTMMLHAKLRWPNAVSTDLWPMAVDYAVHVYNTGPKLNSQNTCPMDLLTRTIYDRRKLNDLHVWGCPAFVLHPTLQEGKKIPKWEPRTRRGMFLGLSKVHASSVPMILNLTTGRISAQFHVVLDDWFGTVTTDGGIKGNEAKEWADIWSSPRFQVFFDADDPIELDEEWLNDEELRDRVEHRAERVANAPSRVPAETQPLQPSQRELTPTPARDPAPSFERENSGVLQSLQTPPVKRMNVQNLQRMQSHFQREKESSPQVQREPTGETEASGRVDIADTLPVPSPPSPSPQSPVRRSKRNKTAVEGTRRSTRTRRPPARFSDYVSNIAVARSPMIPSETVAFLAKLPVHVARQWNYNTNEFEYEDPVAYMVTTQAKKKKKKGDDPDYPMYHQAMRSADHDKWREAMDKEISILEKIKTWRTMLRSEVPKNRKVLPGTWALRVKRTPDGEVLKYKARFCVRGDKQVYGEDYFESYAPVVQWSTVRLMLIMSIVHGMSTRQVDYQNAFAQATLKEDVYIEVPQGYGDEEGRDIVLKLNKSLYGLTQAPACFFSLLKSTLEQRGFVQQENIDPCLFVHEKVICITYVDDCLWFSLYPAVMDSIIRDINENSLTLTVESEDVSAFLGIQFTRDGSTIRLMQKGLMDRVFKTTAMEECNTARTPAEETPLGKDQDGEPFSEKWSYASVVGMLMYLSGNSRPDIAFAVHQCARFTHSPRQSHAKAIKRIVRYLQGTRNKGLILKPSKELKLDCYVDADFAGLWGVEDPQDPTCAKSRTGYILTLGNCPLIWVSKLQTEISLSTMESEYVSLSTAMRDVLPLRRVVSAVSRAIMGEHVSVDCLAHSDVFEDNNGALTLATVPRMTPRSKHYATKYHFFRSHVQSGELKLNRIDTKEQLADIMTKGLPPITFEYLRDKLMGWRQATIGESSLERECRDSDAT